MGSDTQRDEVEREVKTVLFSATLVETPFMLQKHDDVSSASGWNSILVSAPNTDAEDRKFTSFPTEEGGKKNPNNSKRSVSYPKSELGRFVTYS